LNNLKYILCFFVFIASYCAKSQSQPISVPSFVRLDSNHLRFGTDSTAFSKLFHKMDLMQQDQLTRLNVVHIGGSHVQAGIWSNAFSSGLQSYFHTLGGGYFGFPFKYAKTNTQYYLSTFSSARWKKCRAVTIDFCLPLGMAGLSVATNDSAGTFGAALNAKSACRFVNNIRVYHNFNPSFQFQLNAPSAGIIKRIDNVEGGYSLFSFDNPLDSLVFDFTRLDTNQRDFILYGFSLENDLSSGVYLAALGVNGASTSSFLRCSEFTRQLPSLKADLFILSMGVNDTQSSEFTAEKFYSNYDSLITLIRSVNPDAAIILTTTTDNYIRKKTLNKKTVPARNVMYELMEARQVAVWDMFEIMGGPKSIIKWSQAGLAAKDRVHFTGKGYTILGRLMMDALLQAYLESKKLTQK
jgi:lysophospholipase L1-like esterase